MSFLEMGGLCGSVGIRPDSFHYTERHIKIMKGKKSKRDFALHCTHVSQGYLRNLALTALPLSLGVCPYRMAKLTGSILIYYLLAQ